MSEETIPGEVKEQLDEAQKVALEAQEPIPGKEPKPDPSIATLVLTLNQRTGGIQVNGPIDNKFLCYGILEVAKDAIRDYVAQKRAEIAAQEIVPAFTIPPNLRKNGKG